MNEKGNENSNLDEHFEEVHIDNRELKKKRIVGITLLAVFSILFIILIVPKGKKEPQVADTTIEATVSQAVPIENKNFEKLQPEPQELTELEKNQILNELREDSLNRVYSGPENVSNLSEIEHRKASPQKERGHIHSFIHETKSINEPPKPYKYTPSNRMKKRMDSDYQSIVRAFKGNLEQNSWQMNSSEYRRILESVDSLSQVEKPLKDLFKGADKIAIDNKLILGVGTRLSAITEQTVNSDHPSLFTARVVRPIEAKGMKLLCESGENIRGRVPCKIVKLVDKKQQEYTVSGQVEMNGIVGMKGRIRNNWHKRLGPSLINAAIGGGFIAWQMNNEVDSVRIDSRDAVYGPIIQQSTEGLQSEISRLGGDYPNTVVIPKGKEFAILLSNTLTISI